VADALCRSFDRVDDQLRLVGAWRCGCTATVVLLNRTPVGLRIYVANVGDSRCVSMSSRGYERLSRDHRPTDQAEIKRIEADGGFVSRGRVGGVLGVSRALGDHSIKSSGVSNRPHVVARDATYDAAVIIGSDGLWDAVSDADARLVVDRKIKERAPDRAAKSLVEEAVRRGSMDNITCLVAYMGNPAKL
jgi:serine/threonine protein phosphatase PrpC